MHNTKKLFELYESFSSEEDYRASKAISHSILKGVNDNPNILKEPETAPKAIYLDKGSLVDILLTDKANFDRKILVSEHALPSSNMQEIVKTVIEEMDKDIEDITKEDAIHLFESVGLKNTWLPATKQKKIIEGGRKYYKVLKKAEGRTIVDFELLQEAHQMVNKVKLHPWTSKYFVDKNIITQYKIGIPYNGIQIKVMIDIIYINDKDGTITPIDVKTGSLHPRKFLLNFHKYRYYYQGGFYKQALEEFVKFWKIPNCKVLPFKFIFISTTNLLYPTIWDIAELDHTRIMTGWWDWTSRVERYIKGVDELIKDIIVYREGMERYPRRPLEPLDLQKTDGMTTVMF